MPGTTAEVARDRAALPRGRRPDRAARCRHGLHGWRRPGAGRRRRLARALHAHPLDRSPQPAGRRPARRDHRHPAGRRRGGRSLLPARSGQPARVQHRRQRRRMRRRAACLQVRQHPPLRPRPRGRARRRHRHPHRRQDGQERRRLRPDPAPRRLRGDAGDRHRDHAAPGAAAAGAGGAARHLRDDRGRGRHASIASCSAASCRRRSSSSTASASRRCRKYLGGEPLAPAGTEALLVIEVDGVDAAVAHEIALVEDACRDSGATDVRRARDEAERQEVWRARRELSYALRTVGAWKYNHDVVVPKGRIPELFALVDRLRAQFGAADSGLRPRRRRQHPRQHHGRRQRPRDQRARPARPSRRCSRASSRSRGRSPASTASASRRRSTCRSRCRPRPSR